MSHLHLRQVQVLRAFVAKQSPTRSEIASTEERRLAMTYQCVSVTFVIERGFSVS